MKFSSLCKAAALTALLALAAVPAFAQSLTTTYAAGNGQNGNIFDLNPATDITLDRFDIHTSATAGAQVNVEVYWRSGTALGFENIDAGWVLLGTATATSQGSGNPTPVNIGGLGMAAGQTYGIYLRLTNANLAYTNGGPVTFSNAELSLTSYFGKANGDPLMSGGNFYPRQWNGTVYYHLGITPVVTCASEGYTGTKLTWCQNICEKGYTGATLDMWIHRWVNRYRDLPYCARQETPL